MRRFWTSSPRRGRVHTRPRLLGGLALSMLLAAACSGASDSNCEGGVCPTSAVVRVLDDRARSCELLLRDAADGRTAVRFSDAVLGRQVREGGRLAVAVTQRTRAAVPDDAMTLEILGGAPELVSSTCFDDRGEPLHGAGVEVER